MPNLMRHLALATALVTIPALAAHAAGNQDPRLAGSYTFQQNGWTYVHLQGSPSQIGFQHGYILGPQIADALHVFQVEDEHDTKRDWQFFRDAAKTMFWPHIDSEYRAELEGIAAGAQARGIKVDVWDIVALNGTMELAEYYVPWLDKQTHALAAKLDDAGDKLAQAAIEQLYTDTRKVLDKAKLGKVDAIIGQKRKLDIEVQDLAAGRFPEELIGRLWNASMIGDDEEYWPFQGEYWADEYEGFR